MSQCINWNGAINSAGYPVTWYQNKIAYTHRVVAKAKPGEVVMHICDNKKCVNPEHLVIGTHKLNSEDMVAKSRQAKGELAGNSKLVEAQVLQIRKLQGKYSSRQVAEIFSISKTNVLDIWNNRIWRHV